MLILNPDMVRFAGIAWANVSRVQVQWETRKLIEEFGPSGPHAVFVDVGAVRVTVRVTQEPSQGEVLPPPIGTQGELEVRFSPSRADAGVVRMTCVSVLTGVGYDLTGSGSSARVIELVGVSDDAQAGPLIFDKPEQRVGG
jgi:hypothetical protein